MKYRIYINAIRGYELLESNLTYELMIAALNHLIIESNFNDKILVIEHNIKENSDTPKFLYTGNINDFMEFKGEVKENDNRHILKRI